MQDPELLLNFDQESILERSLRLKKFNEAQVIIENLLAQTQTSAKNQLMISGISTLADENQLYRYGIFMKSILEDHDQDTQCPPCIM
jgi:hypothetical protein